MREGLNFHVGSLGMLNAGGGDMGVAPVPMAAWVWCWGCKACWLRLGVIMIGHIRVHGVRLVGLGPRMGGEMASDWYSLRMELRSRVS